MAIKYAYHFTVYFEMKETNFNRVNVRNANTLVLLAPNIVKRLFVATLMLIFLIPAKAQNEIEFVGVYQGKSLFIQNPYLVELKSFCIQAVYINNLLQKLSYNHSALKLDFTQNDLFTPVKIRISSKDSICNPIVINPDAIMFHSSFRFTSIALSDSLLSWQTKGERGKGEFWVEKLQFGIWIEMENQPSLSKYEEADYSYFPSFEEGGNKYRVKYIYENGSYLYSEEVEFNYYPEPVEFTPKVTDKIISFSRSAQYKVYDPNGKEVLSGIGNQVDVSALFPGEYVIYFDNLFPGAFTKKRD